MVALLHSGKAKVYAGVTYITYEIFVWRVQESIKEIAKDSKGEAGGETSGPFLIPSMPYS